MNAVFEPVLLQVPVADIEEHPANPRRAVGNVDELAASIGQVGVLEPVLVCPGPPHGSCSTCAEPLPLDKDGLVPRHAKSARARIDCPGTGAAPAARVERWRLLAGHRRLAAARQEGLATVPAIVRPDITGDAEQLAAMLTENLQRRDLSPVEEADGYAQLRLFGWKVDRVAEATGRPKSTVTSRLRLAKLPDATRERVHAHELTLDVAEKLAEFADDPVLVARLEREAGGWNFAYALERARRDRAAARARARTLKQLTAAGVTVVDEPADLITGRSVEQRVADVVGPLPGSISDREELTRKQAEAVDAHAATCEHHAAVVVDWSAGPIYLCTRPESHPGWEDRKAQRLQDPDADAREKQKAEEQAERDAASQTRVAFARGLLAAPTRIDGVPLLRRAVHAAIGWMHSDPGPYTAVLEMLGAPLPNAKAYQRRRQALRDHVDAMTTVPQLLAALLALQVASLELAEHGGLRSDYGWSHSDGRAAAWLADLQTLGYQPSDVDLRLRDEGEQRRRAGTDRSYGTGRPGTDPEAIDPAQVDDGDQADDDEEA